MAKIKEFPVISRGLPFQASSGGGFGGNLAEANAIDADYGSTWSSVNSANAAAQWFALDIRGLAAGTKTNVWFIWKHWGGKYYDGTSVLGADAASQFASLPRNYVIQGHTSSGTLPAVGDVGWTTLVTVTDNRHNARVHTGLNLSTYGWLRIYCTAASGVTGISEDVQFEFELRDASGGTDDSIFFYGDSITWEGMHLRRPGNAAWRYGPIENVLATLTGRVAPVVINGGIAGFSAADLNANKDTLVGPTVGVQTPCRYVILAVGSNDANLANIDLNDAGVIPNGVNSNYAQTFKTNIQAVIDYCVGLGKICIIPKIPNGAVNTWSGPNTIILNTILDQIRAANPSTALLGPDLYSFFAAHMNCLRDNLHPTFDETVSGGMINGLTGYENYHVLWRDQLQALLYSSALALLWRRRRWRRKLL